MLACAGSASAPPEGRFDALASGQLVRGETAEANASFTAVRSFGQTTIGVLLRQFRSEVARHRIAWCDEPIPDESLSDGFTRRRLPRNVGQEDLVDESQRIAEVASKYLAACHMLDDLGIHRTQDIDERRRRLASICTEEQARVYEATVHHLQSTYEPYIKNTRVEGHERLPACAGTSIALHLLEAATFLTHFVERRGRRAQ